MTRTRASGLFAAAFALALAAPSATAQDFGRSGAHRVEWQATSRGGRPIIAGYVYNDREMRIEHVRLRIELASEPDAPRWSYVSGSIAPGGRGYFEARVPSGAGASRITVESFDWVRCGDG